MINFKNGIITLNKLGSCNVSIDLIPTQNNTSRPGTKMDPKYIVIHNTGNKNKTADAKAHTKYIDTHNGYLSWHFTIDDKDIYQELPIIEPGWHAGDKNGPGNSSGIGIEICENDGIDYEQARLNTFMLIKEIKNVYPNIEIKPHQHFSDKYCPHIELDSKRGFNGFIEDYNEYERKLSIDWKDLIIDEALKAGLITEDSWYNKKDEPAPVWMVLQVSLNILKNGGN